MKAGMNLTQSQLLIWTGQQLQPTSPMYNMTFLFSYNGPIEEYHFKAAFQTLIDKSDAMRTVFNTVQDVPQQAILSSLTYELEILDWSKKQANNDDISKWVKIRNQKLFDLSKILFDAVLIKQSEEKYLFYLNQHHLITDAWSITIQHGFLANYYALSLADQLDKAAAMPAFADYRELEKLSRANEKKEASRQYWAQKAEQANNFPSLYNRNNSNQTTHSRRIIVDLGSKRSDQLRLLATNKAIRSWNTDASMFNLFLTTLFAYIYRISGQQQIAIGAPTHNRVKPILRETLGLFIELFPISVQIEKDETFISLAQTIRGEVNQFLRHAQPGLSTAKLNRTFNCVLNYIHASTAKFNDIPVDSEWIHADHIDSGHHLRLNIYDFNSTGNITASFDLNRVVFDDFLATEAPKQFIHLLDAFIESPDQGISTINILSEAEQRLLIKEFNQTQAIEETDKSVVDLFEEQLIQKAQKIVLFQKDNRISFDILNRKANQLAHFLKKEGIGRNKRVALFLKRSPALLYGILGVLKAGATYIPIPSDSPANRVQELIEEGEADMILSHKELDAKLQNLEPPINYLDNNFSQFDLYPDTNLAEKPTLSDLAYIMFTSGSTGKPKGVMISHGALSNYLQWARSEYIHKEDTAFPLFTMIGFDLTVTSTYLPLISGGQLHIYEEPSTGPDLSLLDVIKDNKVDVIKLTPSHLNLLRSEDLSNSKIRLMIVGGEDFKSNLAAEIQGKIGKELTIINEYGPTEATVGCVTHQFVSTDTTKASVPIGKPVSGMQAYILDEAFHPVARGVAGELYMAGAALADGYWKQPEKTLERFLDNPFTIGSKMYKTGDLVRMNEHNELEYLGRIDNQVKVGGIRVELGEIEAALDSHPKVQTSAVLLSTKSKHKESSDLHYCNKCGLPSNFPTVSYDEEGVCNFCHSFDTFQRQAQQYFKTLEDLKAVFAEAQKRKTGEYDCIMLLSGGKDSSYALGQLVNMGYKVLAFTLDNGYISQQALDNVRRIADEIGVDCIFGETEAMNEIFVDSLHRHCNVCNGCFKTIYTLSMKIALEKGIPIIVTGLSRGQFFETRLTEELFWQEETDVAAIDDIILNARKEYHRVDDAVKRLLDVSHFENDEVFEQVQFVDFYRYTDVSLDEMYEYLDTKLPWHRPTDTGRSTNCLINKLGIFVHTKELGYSNYAFPYSWDVRMGHKNRAQAIDEINEPIDEPEVRQMMKEIGYTDKGTGQSKRDQLVAFYVAETDIPFTEFRNFLAQRLPEYMIPTKFVRLTALPLSANGKVDRKALPGLIRGDEVASVAYEAPSNQIEEMLADIWAEVLQVEQVGINDNFMSLGGNSLEAIRLKARISKAFELELPLNLIFEKPTIAELAEAIEQIIAKLLAEEL